MRRSDRNRPSLTHLTRKELIELIQDLQQQVAKLREENERLKRSQRRQAAPFSKENPVKNPKKPGRKKGEGPFNRRQAPAATPDIVIDVEAPESCPDCGGWLDQQGVEEATTTELPEQPKPKVTQYRVAVCHCSKCGKKVRGTAPGLAADQYGATAHRVGPGLMAAAHALHYSVGVPQRKIPLVLKELTGVSVTQSAIAQDALRRAKGQVGAEYERLRDTVRDRPYVHTDDTGWRVGGKPAFLMGFDTDQTTIYQVRFQHRNEEVREIIPSNYDGVMITDRGKSYDAKAFDNVDQQKCLGHIQRNIHGVLETQHGGAKQFGLKTKGLIQEAMALGEARQGLPEAEYNLKVEDVTARLTYQLRDRILEDDANQTLLNGLGTQDDKGRLMRFLYSPFVDPTNNQGERIIRPAVILRKVSQCSKNEAGAYAFSAFASIAQTARKASASVTSTFKLLFSSPPQPQTG